MGPGKEAARVTLLWLVSDGNISILARSSLSWLSSSKVQNQNIYFRILTNAWGMQKLILALRFPGCVMQLKSRSHDVSSGMVDLKVEEPT